MDLRIAWILAGAVLAGSVVTLWMRTDVRITGTELVHHERYDRLVLQLSGPTQVLRRPETRWRDLIVDLRAIPRQHLQELETGYPRVGTLVIEETPGGARLSSTRRERRLRLFKLEDPTRLVVDFADPDDLLLSAPGEAWGVPMVSPTGPELAYASGDEPIVELEGRSQELESGSPAAWLARGWLAIAPLLALCVLALAGVLRRGASVLRTLRRGAAGGLVSAGTIAVPVERGDSKPREAGPGATEPLARRQDEEVAARIRLEERVLELQEEVRQLRARLTRLTDYGCDHERDPERRLREERA